MIKKEIRIIGIDDSYFTRSQKEVLIVGAITRGKYSLDGVLTTRILVDGMDSTQKITEMINNSRHKPQLKIIMTNGITFAGFNILDIKELAKITNLPVIVIMRKMPNLKKIKNTLKKHFDDWKTRWKIIKKAGKIKKMKIKNFTLFYQHAKISENECKEVIEKSILRGKIPEPLRLAHLIATGISLGESRGKV